MTDDATTIAGENGLFAAVADKPRTVRGLLLPFGEESRLSASNTAPVMFASAAAITLPRDPSVVTLNLEHDRFQPIGRATSLEATPAGVIAEFKIADTDEGDAYLANPSARRLSAEMRGLVRRGALAVTAALTGAAIVTEGAYESAALFALGDVEEQAEPESDDLDPTKPHSIGETIGDGWEVADVSQSTYDTVAWDADDNEVAVTRTTYRLSVKKGDETRVAERTVETPRADDDADEDQTTEAAPAAGEEATMGNAVAPASATQADVDKAHELGANAVFAAMTTAMHGHGSQKAEAEQMLAQLADIKHSGTGALPATGVLQPAWIGEAWRGRAYQRKYITLGTQGTIAAMDAKGFVLDQGTALVQEWGGNKGQLPTGTASTSLVASVLVKYGFAADIAREFFDLPGGEAVIAAFWRGVLESYARITDRKALSQIVDAAGTPVAADAFPDDYPAALGMLIQGIEHIEDAEDTPTFAIMNRLAFRQALYAGYEKKPEFVKFDFGTQGEGTADGFRVVRGDLGITDRPAVLVGSKQGIRFNELGETPIQVDALDIAKGGVDRAAVGYLQTLVERPASFVLVAPPASGSGS